MSRTGFNAIVEAAGFRVRFLRKPLIGPARSLPRSAWLSEAPTPAAPAIRRIAALVEDGGVSADDDSVLIPHEIVSNLPADVAESLGLPAIGEVVLAVASEDIVGRPEARLSMVWRDRAGRRLITRRVGTQLEFDGQQRRLCGPVFGLVEAIEAYNGTVGREPMERVAAWAPVQEALRVVSGRDVDAQAHLQRLSIVQAGSIALDVRATAQGPDFRPVLMSRRKAASFEDDAPAEDEGEPPLSGDLADVITDALLRPDQALVFQREFDKSEPTRDAYVLGSGAYVVLAPELKPVIDLVARMRRAPEVERRAFVKNPRSAIAAALGSDDEYATAPLFIETQQYSERVTELQLWERPALPWMQREAQAWIPEDPIAEQPVIAGQPLDAAIRAQFVDAIAVAKARGEDTITIAERTIPLAEAERQIAITPDDLLSRPNEVVDAPIETAKQAAPQGDKSDAQTADSSGGRHILGVLENFEDETFGASLKPRRALIPYDEAPSERMGPTRPKAHQRDGFDWLVSSWLAGAPGVLLADDMGLGKTFQCLRFLAWLRANQEEAERRAVAGVTRGPILVVAPTALLHNWEKEAEMHIDPRALGGLARAFGGDLTRLKLPDSERPHPLEQLDTAHLVEAGWILTTYETLSNHQLSFARIQFCAVVFDEAQKIKDPGTINAQAAKTVNADFVLAMTGTPIENRVEDLWSIMDRVHPLRLGNLKAFSGKYGAGAPDALRELNGILKSAGSKRPPLMLRRMKEAILDGLPEKRTVTHPVEMPPVQWKAYDTVIAAAHADVSTEGAAYRGRMLEIIQRLRAVSLHPDPDEKNDRNFIAASARLAKTMEVLSDIAGMGCEWLSESA